MQHSRYDGCRSKELLHRWSHVQLIVDEIGARNAQHDSMLLLFCDSLSAI